MRLIYLFTCLTCWLPDVDGQSTLEHDILEQDSLFWLAYNRCDLEAFGGFFAEDLEFYHDKGGLTRTRDSLVASFTHGLCAAGTNQVERRLVAGSLRLYPINNYGAYLRGTHTFHTMVDERETGGVEEAQFAHLWTRQGDRWVMSRVVSYDHHPQETAVAEVAVSEAILHSYVGEYEAPQTGTVSVTLVEGRLQLQSGEMKLVLAPLNETTFAVAGRPLTFEFVAPAGGRATALRVRENGNLVEEARRVD
ncbi:DUF4440 domain-containing protein [Neolewinella sp.]|uniref:nuclear transport factor 2 family protein n=1 Tax=Neolewinella sp. TaxID=2993543 RepID=UPI003B519ACF